MPGWLPKLPLRDGNKEFPEFFNKHALLPKLPLRDGNISTSPGRMLIDLPSETSSKGWKRENDRQTPSREKLPKLPLRDGN